MTEQNRTPSEMKLKSGESIYWCSCGKSDSQPLCDGSHQDSGKEPRVYTAAKDETVWLCNCKQTQTPPFCDGAHNTL